MFRCEKLRKECVNMATLVDLAKTFKEMIFRFTGHHYDDDSILFDENIIMHKLLIGEWILKALLAQARAAPLRDQVPVVPRFGMEAKKQRRGYIDDYVNKITSHYEMHGKSLTYEQAYDCWRGNASPAKTCAGENVNT